MESGIYLIVQFSWPKPFQAEYGAKARALHDALEGQDWIQEVLAGSGGVGGGPSSIWTFRLKGYAGLDQLLNGEGPVSKAYNDFFGTMVEVNDFVRQEVLFA